MLSTGFLWLCSANNCCSLWWTFLMSINIYDSNYRSIDGQQEIAVSPSSDLHFNPGWYHSRKAISSDTRLEVDFQSLSLHKPFTRTFHVFNRTRFRWPNSRVDADDGQDSTSTRHRHAVAASVPEARCHCGPDRSRHELPGSHSRLLAGDQQILNQVNCSQTFDSAQCVIN